jgi:hypothetical protein
MRVTVLSRSNDAASVTSRSEERTPRAERVDNARSLCRAVLISGEIVAARKATVYCDDAFAAAANTLPGSYRRTVTSREPHFGHPMGLGSIEIGKALPRVQSMVRTSSSCCSPHERTDFRPSRRGLAQRIEARAGLPDISQVFEIHENELGTYACRWQGMVRQKFC